MDMQGVLFNIQHMCLHDGPGLRTTVFLKGCPLNCIWCANPESQIHTPQLLYYENKCTGCGNCIEACPHNAVSRSESVVHTDRAKCNACGACVQACQYNARSITGEFRSVRNVLEEVLEDRMFYGEDGGVTISGGEPFAQPEFTGALLKACKEAGITTAVETCGAVSWRIMEPIMDDVDTVLYDLKIMNPVKHQEYTGRDNVVILENLVHIGKEKSCRIIVRVPVISGINDCTENMHMIGMFLTEQVPKCSEISLLPYHNLGASKTIQLGGQGSIFTTDVPNDELLSSLQDVLQGYGLNVRIGG